MAQHGGSQVLEEDPEAVWIVQDHIEAQEKQGIHLALNPKPNAKKKDKGSDQESDSDDESGEDERDKQNA